MRATLTTVALAGLLFAVACQREPAIDEVPVGSDIQLTRQDGALVEGTLTERDAEMVRVDVGPSTRSVPREEIAELRVKDPANPDDLPSKATFREVTVPEATKLSIRLDSSAGSATSREEEAIRGELVDPIVLDEVPVLPVGSTVSGYVVRAEPSGKVKGRASLELRFDRLLAHGQTYTIDARFARTAATTRGRDAEKIAVPAAGGALIGAIIGGKKGAAIGAAAGGGAGTAVVLSTAGPEIAVDSGTVLSLPAGRDIVVRVPIR
jgi:hypothetical protein